MRKGGEGKRRGESEGERVGVKKEHLLSLSSSGLLPGFNAKNLISQSAVAMT